MHKWQVILIISLLSACLLSCGKSEENSVAEDTTSKQSEVADETEKVQDDEEADTEMVEITEKMYVSYVNDIYTNPSNYLGKLIKIEGMYMSYYDELSGKNYSLVYRTGPGCCNNDGSTCGFEFTTQGELPQENDWIEVIGTLDQYEENGTMYLTLSDSKVTVKEERGLEVVSH